ncbi:hypothetical protein K491DRAFT_684671 [Lophiostoma macrostomum CBS 122681]|uniref:Uncharacterized protein n=1 Tax=Lophiostoma macrostomum CBS 122681 TaxID=1314788 RepID=A0A6A6SQN0_9PLEO|nr:hypothetical protein K491DRAFT_684671 [Lophiostoma macrostomum CBS 122681]
MCKERQAREEDLTSTGARGTRVVRSGGRRFCRRQRSKESPLQGRGQDRARFGEDEAWKRKTPCHRCLPCAAADRRVGRPLRSLIGGLLVRHLECARSPAPHTRTGRAQKSPRGHPATVALPIVVPISPTPAVLSLLAIVFAVESPSVSSSWRALDGVRVLTKHEACPEIGWWPWHAVSLPPSARAALRSQHIFAGSPHRDIRAAQERMNDSRPPRVTDAENCCPDEPGRRREMN